MEARVNNETNNFTAADIAQAGTDAPLSNRRDWKYFDAKPGELRVHDVENIIARGRILIEANGELERGSYEATVKRHMDLGDARKYRIIAAHPIISNRGHVHALPPSMRTLYELTRLPPDVLREKLADGSINPQLERKEVAIWRKGEQGEVTVDGKTIDCKPSLTEQLKAARTEIETLKAKLKHAGGSLFDLKADRVEAIAEVIAANIHETKAAALAKAIPEAIKQRKRNQQRPAG
jgi:hypothetical protein